MALSNIFREPRREITESVIGVAVTGVVVGGLVYWDYQLAAAYVAEYPDNSIIDIMGRYALQGVLILVIIAVTAALIGCLLCGIALFTHALGDGICNLMARVGFDPRPKVRR